MKILYIAPENTVGTLNVWKRIHEERGNECKFITMYKSAGKFDDGICLDLPLVWANPFYMGARHRYYRSTRGPLGDYQEKDGYPPVWKPSNFLEAFYFRFRDWLWSFKIEPAIRKYGIMDYDIIHLEWGLELYRDGRLITRLRDRNIPVVCTYHGQDLRTRGVIQEVDKYSRLNLTSEFDLLLKHPNIHYLFLPFDTGTLTRTRVKRDSIRVCHAPTNRYYKGSETIIPVCEQLEAEGKIEFVLIENKTNQEAKSLKSSCDILIDQVHDRGGWGYGMNSVEALSMGLVCVTELNEKYMKFIPDHPFVNVTSESLYDSLNDLIANDSELVKKRNASLEWVNCYHGLESVGSALYEYYREYLEIE